ncbi:hypothetical protein PN462_14405 [Spirulina sp. CS-785/01]|uniref:hypothetical protein n=1 Tax=Spirulina sp. CS-785/01 TaxID=3021716 RepID=UPI00232D9EAC|nr:hypothetical protein [Spirulina sp. CS-785/01]MDB9314302.1 hypothetical protein [Spirulina sp. CS-785/01]
MFVRFLAWRSRFPSTLCKGIAITLTTCFLVLHLSPLANAQFLGWEQATQSNLLPTRVTRIGNIETTEIKSSIDGRTLLTIASPAVRDSRSETLRKRTSSDSLPVEVRAEQVTATIELGATAPRSIRQGELREG